VLHDPESFEGVAKYIKGVADPDIVKKRPV